MQNTDATDVENNMDDPMKPGLSEIGQEAQLIAWRKQRRSELLELRTSFSEEQQHRASEMVLNRVHSIFQAQGTRIAGFYWPFRGEIEVLPLIDRFLAEGGTAALPMVVGRSRPLTFRLWMPGCPMVAGAFGIPYPAESRVLVPDTLVVPLVGYDDCCYRLGYGGGYYDRTLAVAEPKPLSIGIGFASLRLETIWPQQYDVPMDYVVTEAETIRRRA
ncbi:5-formyltetrahydrofolate cyclo-ligase [Tunturiibacter gelidoferens]|jgi:5-formyltetrahydrofolate cyclo-ligase|uniref:5-formyltetrahydrofolate cyclo-ligase n=1 Tax=Tunturiibacter gelidiferens TaxID=3069689 RepID=A0A9X0QIQ0_9BACT|nr:5-formyltetrahydrofolate cyclo-ligase [Edaphobacter lichenicola]MBB5331173.1 5-formyltetrahydrofolate cyclo-ligase [Edaphobacter lichenicola]